MRGGPFFRAAGVRARRLVPLALLAAAASLAGGPPPAAVGAPTYLEGVDVSHFNGSPDWVAAKGDGVRFAIAKATDGQDITDEEYARNMTEADALGLPFTAYHFARPDTTADDAILEADHFLAVANLRGRNLVPVLDLEVHGGLGPRKLRAWAKAWLARVGASLGVKPIIYTGPSFWKDRMGNSRWFADHGYRLWIAHWNVDQPTVPAQNWGGRGWTLWQHDNCGTVVGIAGCVDLDRYRRSDINPLRIRNNR